VQINTVKESQGKINWNNFLLMKWKSSILLVLLCFMRYFCAETQTQTRISSFFFPSLSFTCSTLCSVYFLFLSLTTLLFTLRLSPLHAASHKLYIYNLILSSHTFYRYMILVWQCCRCSGMWFSFGLFHIKLILILPALGFITQLLSDKVTACWDVNRSFGGTISLHLRR